MPTMMRPFRPPRFRYRRQRWILLLGIGLMATFQTGFVIVFHYVTKKLQKQQDFLTATFSENKLSLNDISDKSERNTQSPVDLAESPLNDKTIHWSNNVDRLWLKEEGRKPPAMLLLTESGWNMQDQTNGMDIYRSLLMRELIEGVVNHPWFHPTAWNDINSGKMKLSNTTRYYIFLDYDTCAEGNYPNNGMRRPGNRDQKNGRGSCCYSLDTRVGELMPSRVMASPNAKIVVWNCAERGPGEQRGDRKIAGSKIAFVALSASERVMVPGIDQGLPPPPIKACHLNAAQRKDIQTCNEESRKVKAFFSGKVMRSKARQDLAKLHNGKDLLFGTPQDMLGWMNGSISDITTAYLNLASTTLFGPAPLGGNLFTFRFTEMMSCGAIPVVYADNWVLPFVHDLVNWREAVVIIPENRANQTVAILDAISPEKRCEMRQRSFEIYEKYIQDRTKTVSAVIKGFELEANRHISLTGPTKESQASLLTCGRDNDDIVERLANKMKLPVSFFDKTLCWRERVDRLWFKKDGQPPGSMIVMTHVGWDGKNSRVYHRSLRTRELIQSVINHPWYYPGALRAIKTGNMTLSKDIKYYIFLDLETCGDVNYPNIGKGRQANADTVGNRSIEGPMFYLQDIQYVWQIFRTMKFRLVVLDCEPNGVRTVTRDVVNNPDPHLAIATVSSTKNLLLNGVDQGLPSPTFRAYFMPSKQREDIDQCKEETRDILLSFSGSMIHPVRQELRELFHNGKDILIGKPRDMAKALGVSDPYFELAKRSLFALIPRGFTLGTSRLVEMMSAGAIPVIVANDWALPLSITVNWEEISVIVDEFDLGITVEKLRSISAEKRCKMRKKVMRVYDTYLSNPDANIRGIIEGLEKAPL